MNKTLAPVLMLLGLIWGAAAPLPASAQSDWAACADEGQMCRVRGQALVRFGTAGRYAFRVTDSRVMCDTDEFGDPAPQQVKRCEVSYNWRRDERYSGWRDAGSAAASGGWRLCANEGEVCRVPGSVRVRYGANGRYAYRDANNAVLCNNTAFGDPTPEIAKQCDYQVDDGAGPSAPGKTSLVWDRCSNEGARCNVSRDTMVRYGRDGRWYYREVSRGVDCGNRAFGGDPMPDQPKRCESLRLNR